MVTTITPRWQNDDWWRAYCTAVGTASATTIVVPPPELRFVTVVPQAQRPPAWGLIMVAASAALVLIAVALLVWR